MSEAIASSGHSLRYHGLRLAALAIFTALLLTFAYNFTRAQIASQRLDAQRQSLNEVMPATLHDNDVPTTAFKLGPDSPGYRQPQLLGLSTTRTGYLASLHGKVSGVILPFETQGYGGIIVMRIGIALDGSIVGVRVLQHSETPGLGSNIELGQSSWISSFDQSSLANTQEAQWQVKMDGGKFDEFVGATITPRAVTAAIHNALLFFDANKDLLLSATRETPSP